MLNLLLLLGSNITINTCDPLQNPGQTKIYKLGQSRLTLIKHHPDNRTWFNPVRSFANKSMYHIAGKFGGEKFGEIGEFGKITSHLPIKTRQTHVPSSKSSTFAKLFLAKTSRCPIRQTFPPPNFPAIRY